MMISDAHRMLQKYAEVIEEEKEKCRSVIGEQIIGQFEAAILCFTANTKTTRRASLSQKLKRLGCTKETTHCDVRIKNRHTGISLKKKKLLDVCLATCDIYMHVYTRKLKDN